MTTKLFRHRFNSVEGYLHHRAPYLLIDQVVEIHDQAVTTSAIVGESTFFTQGHFPGAPILPGALMQEMTTQSAGVLLAANFNPMDEFNTEDPFFNEYALGVLVKVHSGRYRGFARPGDRLEIQVELKEQVGTLFDFTARIRSGEEAIYRNAFQLTNIPSAVLQGNAS